MYLIITKSCDECNKTSLTLKSEKPVSDLINKLEEDLGGMYCIRSKVVEIYCDGDTEELEEL